MVDRIDKLAQLQHLARIKAEQELKRLAAFSAHIDVANLRVAATRTALQQSYRDNAPLGIAEARMANAQAARAARELAAAERELARLRPTHEKMRAEAAKEFGRAEVLAQLVQDAHRKAGSGRW